MRIILLIFLSLLITSALFAQREIKPTAQLLITGKVKEEIEFDLADIINFEQQQIPDIIIRNHQGEVKSNVNELKGFLLKDMLKLLEFPVEKPHELNEFYFTLIGSDGYKVVFSYNEIFNSAVGDALYVVCSKGEQSANEMPESILIVSASDKHIGPRYIKGVELIYVGRVY